MESIEIKPLPVAAQIRIPEPRRIGKKAVTFENVSLGYGEKTILSQINLTLVRGDKIGVVGFNGVGKSTLLKGIGGSLSAQKGQIHYGMDVEVGYYAQHVAEELNLNATILEELENAADPSVTQQEALDLAGSLLFSGDRVHMRIGKLSGGEKARVALGKILLMKVPILVLDEVTNHLDFHTVEALTQALKQYAGTLVLVSHDRGFIRRVADQILEIRESKVLKYPGSYDEYVWSLEKGALAQATPHTSHVSPPKKRQAVPSRQVGGTKEEKKALQREIRELDKQSKEIESAMSRLQERLQELSKEMESGKAASSEALKELGSLPHDLVAMEERWIALQEKKDEKSKALQTLS